MTDPEVAIPDVAVPEVAVPGGSQQVKELPLTDEVVGPEGGIIRCTLKVSKRQFVLQQSKKGLHIREWTIRANTVDEFRDLVWTLAKPHLKRTINIDTVAGFHVPSWGELPCVENIDRYIDFVEKRQKRKFVFSTKLSPAKLNRCKEQGVMLVLYQYTKALASRQLFEIAQMALEGMPRNKGSHAPAPRAVDDGSHAVPRRSKRTLPRGSQPSTDDDYTFSEEVQALRETFVQMRDLVRMLDYRIALLEAKCNNQQPSRPEPPAEIRNATVDLRPTGHPDPLLQADQEVFVIKVEPELMNDDDEELLLDDDNVEVLDDGEVELLHEDGESDMEQEEQYE